MRDERKAQQTLALPRLPDASDVGDTCHKQDLLDRSAVHDACGTPCWPPTGLSTSLRSHITLCVTSQLISASISCGRYESTPRQTMLRPLQGGQGPLSQPHHHARPARSRFPVPDVCLGLAIYALCHPFAWQTLCGGDGRMKLPAASERLHLAHRYPLTVRRYCASCSAVRRAQAGSLLSTGCWQSLQPLPPHIRFRPTFPAQRAPANSRISGSRLVPPPPINGRWHCSVHIRHGS